MTKRTNKKSGFLTSTLLGAGFMAAAMIPLSAQAGTCPDSSELDFDFGFPQHLVHSLENCDINKQDMDGDTALMVSSRIGDQDISKELLLRGANPNLINKSGASALLWAVANGSVETVEMLLEKGADLNYVDGRGNSAFGLAARVSYEDKSYELMTIMLAKGADINIKDSGGVTPLMYAIYSTDFDKVDFLLRKGADVTIKNNEGQSAVDIAATRGGNMLKMVKKYSPDYTGNDRGDREQKILNAVKNLPMPK